MYFTPLLNASSSHPKKFCGWQRRVQYTRSGEPQTRTHVKHAVIGSPFVPDPLRWVLQTNVRAFWYHLVK